MQSSIKTEPGGDPQPRDAASPKRSQLARLAPLLVVIAGLVAVFATGLNRYLSLEELEARRAELQAFVRLHPVQSLLIYTGVYVAVVAFSIPGAMIMTMSGGFLFGPFVGTAAAVVGASTGAILMFLVARSSLGDLILQRAKPGGAIRRLEAGIRENAFTYMLVMRIVPAIPFWLVNIAAGCVRIPMRTYVISTVVGIIPSTFVYSSIGSGLNHVFDRGDKPDMRLLFDPQVYLPLFGLGLLCLLPILVHAWRVRRRRRSLGGVAE